MRPIAILSVVTCILVPGIQPVAAQKDHSHNSVPAQQSQCEIAANKFKAAHPKMDMFDKRNLFPQPFGERAPPPRAPFSFRDLQTGITFYVEDDGRHITAKAPTGKILWVRNPFVDSDMCPYRSAHPFIFDMSVVSNPSHPWPELHTDAGANARIFKDIQRLVDYMMKNHLLKERPKPEDRYVGVSFNSSQFGFLNIRTGDFYFAGQN